MIATSAAAQDFYLEPPYGSPGGGDTIKFEAISPAIDFRAALPEVLFAGISAVVTVIDSKTLTAVTPPHKEGAVEVQLRLDGTTYTTPYKFGYIVPREPILIPLAIETPGAYGTRWTTDIWVYNDAEEPVNLLPEVCFGFANPFPCGEGLLVGSHGSIRIPPYVAYNDLSVYTFLYPPTAVRNRLHFSVRIRNAADPDDV
ncbi:MAG: IPT/TIG domain-containing protein, partial [Thermoanaerobaculia bacterium]